MSVFLNGIKVDQTMQTYAVTATSECDISRYATLDSLKLFKELLLKEIYSKPLVKQTCHSCGATLEIEHDKHIFICKYCGSCYAIGTRMVNSASN